MPSHVANSAWTIPALVATDAAAATLVLAAGTAKYQLIVVNEGGEAVRIAFDGEDASSTHGLSLAAGEGFHWLYDVPSGKISGYSTNTVNVFVAYC